MTHTADTLTDLLTRLYVRLDAAEADMNGSPTDEARRYFLGTYDGFTRAITMTTALLEEDRRYEDAEMGAMDNE